MATLRDIAKEAGVSVATVSDVLNGNQRGVRRDARDRARHILEVAQRLGYRPNTAARITRTGRFGCVGLLVPPVGTNAGHMSFELWLGIQDELSCHDIHTTLARLPGENCQQMDDLPKVVTQQLVDGLLVNYTHNIPTSLRKSIDNYRIPAIWINSEDVYDCVRPDDFAAGKLAAQTLLERRPGLRKLGYLRLGGDGHFSEMQRLAGVQEVASDAGIALQVYEKSIAKFGPGAPDLCNDPRLDLAMQWLNKSDRPDAVVTYSGWTAQPLLMAAMKLGLGIPDELAMVTIEDEPVVAQGFAITTITLNIEQMAREAVNMLLAKIDEPDRQFPALCIASNRVDGRTA